MQGKKSLYDVYCGSIRSRGEQIVDGKIVQHFHFFYGRCCSVPKKLKGAETFFEIGCLDSVADVYLASGIRCYELCVLNIGKKDFVRFGVIGAPREGCFCSGGYEIFFRFCTPVLNISGNTVNIGKREDEYGDDARYKPKGTGPERAREVRLRFLIDEEECDRGEYG